MKTCQPIGSFRTVLTFSTFFALCYAAHSASLIGPLPYLSQADSPFAGGIQAGTVYLETFEDGALNTPYVSVSATRGAVTWPGAHHRFC